jgi:hypothetical protein
MEQRVTRATEDAEELGGGGGQIEHKIYTDRLTNRHVTVQAVTQLDITRGMPPVTVQ